DLLRWNQNFTAQKVGGKTVFDAQHQKAHLNDGSEITYAAGLVVSKYKGVNEVSHSGATAGYRAWLARYPAQGVSVAVLCNAASANAPNLGHAVADVVLADVLAPQEEPAVAFDLASADAFVGTYRSTRDHDVMRITASNGQLRAGNRILRVAMLAPDSF